MPLVLRPKTFPMEMFQPKCQPSANPSRPPVSMTFRPPEMPPMKMLSMLRTLEPPGDRRCITTKKPDSASTARKKAKVGLRFRWAMQALARLCSIHPRRGNSSFKATFRWKTTSQKMQTTKDSERSKTSNACRKCTQPASSSTTKMKNTIATPTPRPARVSEKNGPSSVSPMEARLRLSIQLHVHQTTMKDPRFMPVRTQASLHRCRPVT
mmetsp:Transcript_43631/g.98445  ORF Transcript_43631/g.98445 Transcript_43631/m.98445 type:complete len:210 (+) Transcript_43631:272-901(+)